MRKNTNKILAITLLSTMLFAPVSVHAQGVLSGDSGTDNGYVVPEKTQIEEALETAETQEQIDDLNMKMAIVNGVQLRASYPATTIAVKQFEQENGHYCGPATTRQTLYYMTGSAPAQGVIAKDLGTTTDGTDGAMIVKYLNQKQNKVTFTTASDTSVSGMKSRIAHALTARYKRPPIMRSKFKQGNVWDYDTNGHFMNISGYTTDIAKVRITDPNITRIIKGHSGSYSVNFSDAQKAILDHPSKHLYW